MEPSYFQYQGADKPPGYTEPAPSKGVDWWGVLSNAATQATAQPAAPRVNVPLVLAALGVAMLTIYLVTR